MISLADLRKLRTSLDDPLAGPLRVDQLREVLDSAILAAEKYQRHRANNNKAHQKWRAKMRAQ